MPRLKLNKNPSLRRHKASGQGVVTLSGRDHYCGSWPAEQVKPPPAVERRYLQVVGVWNELGRRPLTDSDLGGSSAGAATVPGGVSTAAPAAGGVTVGELMVRFWRHVEVYYRHPDGRPTREQEDFKR